MTRSQSRTATTEATSADGGWHALSANEALAHHGVDPAHGLAEDEAATRLARHGPNRPSQQPGRSAFSRFFGQMKEPLVLVLIASGIVTGALGEWIDSSVIFGVVLVNAVIGYLQEDKAEAALAALARGEADALVVLDGDLDRRAQSLLVDDLLRREVPILALSTLEDRVTARADVVLPTATFAEETGTWVNHEGRAQRYFAVLPPAADVRPAWRWLRELLVRLGRREALGWRTPDDVLAALELELPAFRGAGDAAPPAGWRSHGRTWRHHSRSLGDLPAGCGLPMMRPNRF